MEAIKKTERVVIDDHQYQVEGSSQDLGDGSFQSICNIVTWTGDATRTRRLTFQIFTQDPDLAAEVGLLCGANTLSTKKSSTSEDQ